MFDSLPPWIFSVEGWLTILICMLFQSLSWKSLGKRSLAHEMFFTSLQLWSPTDSCVEKIANVPGANRNKGTTTGKRGTTTNTKTTNTTTTTMARVPMTSDERLEALELMASPVTPGLLFLTSIGASFRAGTQQRQQPIASASSSSPSSSGGGDENYRLWIVLDKLTIHVASTLVFFALRWILAWERAIRHPCCDEYRCWVDWTDSQRVSIPIVAVLTAFTMELVLRLGKLATKLPDAVSHHLRYPPASYVTMYLTGLVAFATSHLLTTFDARSGGGGGGGISMGIHEGAHGDATDDGDENDIGIGFTWIEQYTDLPRLQPAFDELAARLLLWSRLVGMRIEDEPLALSALSRLGHVSIAFVVGWLAFLVTDPIQATVKHHTYHFLAKWQTRTKRAETNTNTNTERIGRYCSLAGSLGVAILPLAIIITYFSKAAASLFPCRPHLIWSFVTLMVLMTKPVLQSYLEQGLPAIVAVISNKKRTTPPTVGDLKLPFHSRIHNLLKTACQLMSFPFLIITLLIIGHLCSSHSISSGSVMPGAYGAEGMLDHDAAHMASMAHWERSVIVHTTTTTTTGAGTTSSSSSSSSCHDCFSPTRAMTCGKPVSVVPQKEEENVLIVPDTVHDVLLLTPLPPISIARVLKGIQKGANDTMNAGPASPSSPNNKAEDENNPATSKEKKRERRNENDPSPSSSSSPQTSSPQMSPHVLWTAFFFHPVLTSTIVMPLLEFVGLLMCLLWIVRFYGGLLYYWKPMRDLLSRTPFSVKDKEVKKNR